MVKGLSRRRFMAATAAAIGSAVLVACGATPTPTPTPAPPKPAQPTAAPPTPKPPEPSGKITCLFHGGAAPESSGYWAPRLKMFREAYPKIECVAIGSESDEAFVQKISTMVAGGTPPDMAKPSGGRLIATANKDIYEQLEPRIEKSALMQRIWKLLPGEGKEMRFCGRQFAIPMDVDHRLWFYNKDIFDKAGVPYPSIEWTWDDLLKIGEKVTKPAENQYLVIPGVVSFQDYAEWVWQAGGSKFSEDCMHVNLSEPPNILAMEFLVDLFKKYKYAPSPGLKLGEIGVSFDSGKIALNMSNTGTLATQLGPKPTWNFQWSAVFAPKGPVTAQGFIKSNGFSVIKNSARPDLGWLFIEWWFSDETQTKFAEMGELVPRSDIREKYSLKKIPEHLHPAMIRAGQHARGLERCPGWNAAQKHWKQELDTAITGDVPVKQAMEAADKKAELELSELMKGLCDFLKK